MQRIYFILVALTHFVVGVSLARAETICLGPVEAEMQIIYLHGLNAIPEGAKAEQDNRIKLETLAKELNARIAMPKSPQKCRNGVDDCWKPNRNRYDKAVFNLEKAKELSSSCFGTNKKAHLVGFSNGGYLVNQALKYCLKKDFLSYISIGAGGEITGTKDLSKCPGINLIVGKKDGVLKESERFVEKAKSNKAQIVLYTHDGGHEIPTEQTLTILKLVKKKMSGL